MNDKTLAEEYPHYEDKIIQEKANQLVRQAFLDIQDKVSDLYFGVRSVEDQHDKGIDFHVEMESRSTSKTVMSFFVQNKGVGKKIKPKKKDPFAGYISYPLRIRHSHYYRNELPGAVMFFVCDTVDKKVYWHPIQLDSHVERHIEESEPDATYARIYLAPERVLAAETAERFLKELMESQRVQSLRFRQSIEHELLKEQPQIFIDKSQHILDQLHSLIKATHRVFSFVPINMLSRNYPIAKKEKYIPVYSGFSMRTDNEAIMEMFENISVKDHKLVEITNPDYFNGVADAKEKLIHIFTKLSENLIYEFHDADRRKKGFHFHLWAEHSADSVRRANSLFDFETLLKAVSEPTTDMQSRLEKGYLHYKLGNFIAAANVFSAIAQEAQSKNDHELYFLSTFNLTLLARLIRNRYHDQIDHRKNLEKWLSIKLDHEYELHKNADNEKLLKWLKDRAFFSDTRDEMTKTVNQIKTFFYNGGSSSGSFVTELIVQYAGFVYFLNQNFIVYDIFEESTIMSELFVEGIMAAHGNTTFSNGKLPHVDDWMFYEMVVYSNKDQISRYFNRYYLKKLHYRPTDTDGCGFLDALQSFLTKNGNIIKLSDQNCEAGNFSFVQDYSRIFSNLIFLAALTDFGKEDVAKISTWLLSFLRTDLLVRFVELEPVGTFMVRHHRSIPKQVMGDLLSLFIQKSKLHSSNFIEHFHTAAVDEGMTFALEQKEFDVVLEMLFGTCPHCPGNNHEMFAPFIHDVLQDEGQKRVLCERISARLELKFDYRLFYLSAIFGIIPSSGQLFDKYVEQVRIIPGEDSLSLRSMFVDDDNPSLPQQDEILNLCFKKGIDPTSLGLEAAAKVNPYYEWIFNIDFFDYSKWNPLWLSIHSTKYYFNEFRKHPIIKSELEKYLNKRRDPRIERIYFDLYKSREKDVAID